MFNINNFVNECIRVLKIINKPYKKEFISIVKVTGIGICVIGLIGFLLHIIKELIM